MSADWRTGLVDRVRDLILDAEPEVVEEAKWRKASNPDGVPTFSCSGLLCTVETYKDKVKVTFGCLPARPDRDLQLEPGRRHPAGGRLLQSRGSRTGWLQ
jgi:hypothetical protein